MTRYRKGQTRMMAVAGFMLLTLGVIFTLMPADNELKQCTTDIGFDADPEDPAITKALSYVSDAAGLFLGLSTCNIMIGLIFNISLLVFLIGVADVILP